MSASYSALRDADNVNDPGRSSAVRLPASRSNTRPKATSPSLRPYAPIASTENDDDLDDREVVSTPYPGVDDGFFTNDDNDKGHNPDVETINPKPHEEPPKHPDVETVNPTPPQRPPRPDVERIPSVPKDPEPMEPPDDIPSLFPRIAPDGENDDDEADGAKRDGGKHDDGKHDEGKHDDQDPSIHPFLPHKPGYPYAPSFGPDLEVGSIPGGFDNIPDVNIYQHKKTLAQGMMDLALFSANANQLRYVLESYNRHPYYYPSIVFISFSLLLQVAIGIGLIWNATYSVKDEREICIANRINNYTVVGIFLVTVINVFISAFGVANPPT